MEGQQPRWVYWEVSHPYCFQNHTVYKTWPLELLYCICLDALSLSLTRNKDYLASVHGCSIRFSCVIYPSCPPEELFLLSEQKVTQGNASSQKLQASREKPSLTEIRNPSVQQRHLLGDDWSWTALRKAASADHVIRRCYFCLQLRFLLSYTPVKIRISLQDLLEQSNCFLSFLLPNVLSLTRHMALFYQRPRRALHK